MRLLPIMTFSLVGLLSITTNANADTLAPSSTIGSVPIQKNNTPTNIQSNLKQSLPNKNNQCNKSLNYKVFFEGNKKY